MNAALNVYVASSWRNLHQPDVVGLLQELGYDVYDFRNNGEMFHWRELDKWWKFWDLAACEHHLARTVPTRAFEADFTALQQADAVVLVMPCGRSAHLELGYAVGAGIPTAVLYEDDTPCDPELMIKMTDLRSNCLDAVIFWLAQLREKKS